MKVVEIFGSIDGEGLRTGELATFIRLAGCNLRCRYCDTSYALQMADGEEMTIEDILNKVEEIGYKNITLTGGEPLIHKDVDILVNKLTENGYKVNIETNGSIDIKKYLLDNVLITMDYKTIASGESSKMLLDNINKLRETDVIKFVCNSEDLSQITRILKKYKPKCYIYLSPIFNEIQPYELVEYLKSINKEIDTSKIRIQVQLHKIIWEPNERGV